MKAYLLLIFLVIVCKNFLFADGEFPVQGEFGTVVGMTGAAGDSTSAKFQFTIDDLCFGAGVSLESAVNAYFMNSYVRFGRLVPSGVIQVLAAGGFQGWNCDLVSGSVFGLNKDLSRQFKPGIYLNPDGRDGGIDLFGYSSNHQWRWGGIAVIGADRFLCRIFMLTAHDSDRKNFTDEDWYLPKNRWIDTAVFPGILIQSDKSRCFSRESLVVWGIPVGGMAEMMVMFKGRLKPDWKGRPELWTAVSSESPGYSGLLNSPESEGTRLQISAGASVKPLNDLLFSVKSRYRLIHFNPGLPAFAGRKFRLAYHLQTGDDQDYWRRSGEVFFSPLSDGTLHFSVKHISRLHLVFESFRFFLELQSKVDNQSLAYPGLSFGTAVKSDLWSLSLDGDLKPGEQGLNFQAAVKGETVLCRESSLTLALWLKFKGGGYDLLTQPLFYAGELSIGGRFETAGEPGSGE